MDPMRKREQFAVSLRRQKKNKIIASKRKKLQIDHQSNQLGDALYFPNEEEMLLKLN